MRGYKKALLGEISIYRYGAILSLVLQYFPEKRKIFSHLFFIAIPGRFYLDELSP